MKRALLIVIAVIILTPAVAVAKHGKPHADTVPTSITVPPTVTFGTSVTPEVSYGQPLNSGESLWVRVTCLDGGSVALVGWAQPGLPIRIDTTPSWNGPEADCVADLVVWDAFSDTPAANVAATASFQVIP